MKGEEQSGKMIGEKQSGQAQIHDCYAMSVQAQIYYCYAMLFVR